jgi:hypothetical protein
LSDIRDLTIVPAKAGTHSLRAIAQDKCWSNSRAVPDGKVPCAKRYFSTGGNEAREYPYLGHDQQIADQAANSEQLARLEKQRLAKIEGAIASAEVDKEYVDVRKNMERLKALRLAKEAEDAANPPPVEPKRKKAAPKKLAIVKASEPEAVGGE